MSFWRFWPRSQAGGAADQVEGNDLDLMDKMHQGSSLSDHSQLACLYRFFMSLSLLSVGYSNCTGDCFKGQVKGRKLGLS